MQIEVITENRPEVLVRMRTAEQMKVMKAMRKFLSVICTEYAYSLLAEKNTEHAEKARKAFEKYAGSYPCPGGDRK